MKQNAAFIALVGVVGIAGAQPGDRSAIVYAARGVGETAWHVGTFSHFTGNTEPVTFEVGVFFFRDCGLAHSTAVYKAYIDGVSEPLGDSAMLVDDAGNGVSPLDGRQDVFNSGAQNQGVFTNRKPGTQRPISTATALWTGSTTTSS